MSTRFDRLVEQWQRETGGVSNPWRIQGDENYLAIIAMGREVIPDILLELKENGGGWFAALRALTGENPVEPVDAGYVQAMRDAWVEWGIENGYIQEEDK